MTPPDKGLSFKEYVFLREEIRHQDNLVNARLSWLVSSQALIHRMTRIRGLARSSHPSHLPTVQAEVGTRQLGLAGPVLIPVVFLAVWLAIIVQRWLL